MKFKDIISITGKPGLYELINARQDGLIVSVLGEDKKTFISSRKHMFTPLENIGIYLQSGETIELAKVFKKLDGSSNKPGEGAKSDELKSFFRTIVQDYDEERVYISDIKKIVKWHTVLTDFKIDFKTSQDEAQTDEEE